MPAEAIATDHIQDAEERGRRRGEVDARLEDHDRRFTVINGSIERGARAQEKAADQLGKLEKKVDGVISKVETAEQVSKALAKAAASRRDLLLAVAAIVAALVAAVIGGHIH